VRARDPNETLTQKGSVAFNLPNAVKLLNPLPANPGGIPATMVLTNANFGRVVNVQEPRIMQWALKYVF
jgi:hypothetical protein